ncbi:S1 RNA-binding domain-containing protein [Streptomyces sp. NPDC056300]|uniref:S1 RNA-binding domain-containing protein n=1 Tax=Streptomyces sp. NPDC056300 TaxID=3345777 RepID=UPI0035DE23CC
MINQLQPGAVRTVKVIGFDGADLLVELVAADGGTEIGRIPRQEASMRRMENPSELFEVGQEIKAEEIGRWREGQLHLSARACEIPALRSFLLAFERGQVVAGTVSEVHNFGVFVHVDGEPDGLCTGFIRVPDLTWGWINHPSEAVEVGQRITAEVIIAETRSGQVTLSLKALQEDPLIRFADQVGRVLTSPITKIVPFGVFVQLAPDVVGFLVAGAEGMLVAYAGGRHFAPGWYAVLMGCLPVGMLVGDLLVGRLLRPPTRERLVVPLIALMGLPLVGFAAEPGVGVSSCLLLLCGFGFAYGLGLQRPFLDALPQDGQGHAFGLLGSGSMTLQGVGPACFGSVAAVIGTGGAIALAGGAAVLTAGWILTWHPPTSPVPVPNYSTGSENGTEQHACSSPAQQPPQVESPPHPSVTPRPSA